MFSGPISPEARYHLKSISGSVEMAIRDKPSGLPPRFLRIAA
ncbi:MAG: hypothetical protein QOJ64_2258 [Acidobacteriota bacterium]|jgi:hypothetical protein|nr:hypothetical protein [Acidobacteriota bacterium]